MEGSRTGRSTGVAPADPRALFERAGLPINSAVAWHNRFSRHREFQARRRSERQILAHRCYPDREASRKPQRNVEQKRAADIIISSCRRAREGFLQRHADTVYRKLTGNLAKFVRIDYLAYDAGKLVPGLTPTREQVDAECTLMQSDKDGVEVDQGIFLAQVLAVPAAGMHLCKSTPLPKPEAIERSDEFAKHGVINFGPTKIERQGKAAVVTVCNPRFLNAEDDDTLDDTETAADIAMLDPASEIWVLRGDVVDHLKYRGRRIFSAGF